LPPAIPGPALVRSVAQWLESLGLGEYRESFARNAVDASVLSDLTERDLGELGVRIGHRRKLLRAIAELGGSVLQPSEEAAGGPARGGGERRQVTALFCDLVNSSALANAVPAEEWLVIMKSYRSLVTEVIATHEGIVEQFVGDGVLALFGYPEAHEDDAEQAVRAGVALVDAIANLNVEILTTAAVRRLQARVGIATGTVLVSGQGVQGSFHRPWVVGVTPNLGSRLHELAEPGAVVISADTRALTGGLFECRDLGARTLKGWPEPIPVWQVVAPSGAESRFEAKHGSRLAPLLGRDEELELLQRRWRDVAKGEGRVVILTGEAGVGKSHVALALQERLAAEPHTVLRYFCSAHHLNSALFPFIGQLERAAGFERHDKDAEKLAKLATLVAQGAPHGEDAMALVANLLSLPSVDRDRLQQLSPQKRKERTLAVLLGAIDALAARQPVLMIVEDAHWIDPTSLELLTILIERDSRLPILLLITARTKERKDEFKPPWAARAHVKTIMLNYLGRGDSQALVTWVAGGRALPGEVMNEIVGRADGVPLYLEEYTKTVLESGQLEERGGRYVLNRPLPSLAIPNTLHASLMERLDRLHEAREVAQAAAVVGREFSYELLDAVPGPHRENLGAALGELERSELVFRRGEVPYAVYRFKHALLRDEAYAGLLKDRRIALHAAIANAIEQRFPEIVAAQPETLGYHLSKACLARRAIPYWLQAGRIAARRFANLEAIAHLRKGIEETQALPEGAERDRLELDLICELAPCLIATQGPDSGESLVAFTRARQLCESLGDAQEYPQVMFWLVTASVIRGEFEQALEGTAAMGRAAEARGDRAAFINAVRGQAMIQLFMGRIVESQAGIERALELFDAADEEQRLAARAAGQDAGAASHALMSWVLWLLGYTDAAVTRVNRAFERVHAIAHPHTEAYACYYAAILHALRGEYDTAHGYAERCFTLSEEHGFRQWLGLARAIRGICMSVLEPSSSSLEEVKNDLEQYRAAGHQLGITVLHVLLCQALLLKRRPEIALEAIDQALSTAERNSERIVEAELFRLKARALLDCGEPQARANARSCLERALATARNQRAKSLELRAASDIAALLLEEGRSAEARSILEPICAWFTEGAGTSDLRTAKALLERRSEYRGLAGSS
jgi:class 3 adenylate cyclase/predicted ATPase